MSGHGICPDRTIDVNVEMDTTFSKMNLIHERIRKGLSEADFIVPSPIQRKALPRTLCGLDVISTAKSGTGKTAVFAITALQSIIDLESNQPQVLILAPTREIAVQIVDVVKSIGKFVNGLKVEWFIGGTPIQEDLQKLKNCRIVVGAPGRIAQLIELGHLNTKSIRLFVADEADQMFQPSFTKDFNYIYNNLPTSKQVLIFSATFTWPQIQFLHKYMTDFCLVSGDKEDDDTVEEKLSFASLLGMRPFVSLIKKEYLSNPTVLFHQKMTRLREILQTTTISQCLIFTNFKTGVKTISNQLCDSKFVSTFLSSEQSQPERLKAIEDLKLGKSRILVTTDLAARGIDVQNVDTVINFEPPYDEQTYLHRMGRAGRYGSHGIVISIVAENDELVNLQKILSAIKGSALVLPSPSIVDAADINKVKELGLKEISGLNNEDQLPPSETDDSSCGGYILHKECLKKIYGRDVEDINLKHLRSDIDSLVKKLAQRHELTFDMDAYFATCKKFDYFHPQLVDYVEKTISNLTQNKKPVCFDRDLKENIPMNKHLGNVDNANRKTKNSQSKKVEPVGKAPNLVSRNYKYMCLGDSFEDSLLDKLFAYIAERADIDKIKPLLKNNFEKLRDQSSDFEAKLVPELKTIGILSESHGDFSSCKVTPKNGKVYYYFCKYFKTMDQHIVQFVERKLRQKEDTLFEEIQAVLPSKVGFADCASKGVPLPASSIKRKPASVKGTAPKNPDPPPKQPKYLYLKQNFLKTLYGASKVSKDFCVETYRPSIEQSFYLLWKSSAISTDTIQRLSSLDIIRRPAKFLNNWTLESYFQFSRHFRHLNPELVEHVSQKIEKIEGRGNEMPSDEDNSSCIPAKVLAPFYSESCNSTSIIVDEAIKEKTMSRFLHNSDFLLKLQQALADANADIFVDQSVRRYYCAHYFKLCQTFKKFDDEFICHVNQKIKEVTSISSNQAKGSQINGSNKTSVPKEIRQEVVQPTTSVYERIPSISDLSSTENFITQPYKELAKYPLVKSNVNAKTEYFNPELNLALDQAQTPDVTFVGNASYQDTVKLMSGDDKKILKAVSVESVKEDSVSDSTSIIVDDFTTQSYKELAEYPPAKSVINSRTEFFNPNLDLSPKQAQVPNTTFADDASHLDTMKLMFKDDEKILITVRVKSDRHHQINARVGKETTKHDSKLNGATYKPCKISSPRKDVPVECENGSSAWVSASSSGNSDMEEDHSVLENSHSASLNLCDRCKTWYQSSGSAEIPDVRARSSKHFKSKAKKTKKHSYSSHHGVIPPCPAPSYDQLLSWYNMWYQQVVFSQQFVWWNEYLRSMSSHE